MNLRIVLNRKIQHSEYVSGNMDNSDILKISRHYVYWQPVLGNVNKTYNYMLYYYS